MLLQKSLFYNFQDFNSSQLPSHTDLSLIFSLIKIEQQDLLTLCSTLQNCKNLKILQLLLDSNEINNEIPLDFGEAFANLTELTISFYFNEIGPEVASSFALSLEKCTKLTYLFIDFTGNSVGSQGLFGLASGLSALKQLVLNLNFNCVSDEGILDICTAIQQCNNLWYLEFELMDNNELSQESKLKLKQQVKKLKRLVFIICWI
ncbi:hypothetical protein ABPG74_019022 [Tetrahymena malaccensis]